MLTQYKQSYMHSNIDANLVSPTNHLRCGWRLSLHVEHVSKKCPNKSLQKSTISRGMFFFTGWYVNVCFNGSVVWFRFRPGRWPRWWISRYAHWDPSAEGWRTVRPGWLRPTSSVQKDVGKTGNQHLELWKLNELIDLLNFCADNHWLVK